MKDTEYTYAVSYLKTLENKMLEDKDYDVLINSGYDNALKFLRDKGYGFKESPDSDILEDEMKKIWQEAEGVMSDPSALDILKVKNDFHNLKTILKAFITNMPWENLILSPSVIDPGLIYSAVSGNNFSNLPDFLTEVGREAYRIVTREHDGQKAEIYIDKMAFSYLKSLSEKNDFLNQWIDENIIFINILIAQRCFKNGSLSAKEAFIETNKINLEALQVASETGDFSEIFKKVGYTPDNETLDVGAFEKWCERKKTELFSGYKHQFFGIEPIIAFILAKDEEVKKLRIILSCLKNHIPTEIIKERL